jgi:hypothetical protein
MISRQACNMLINNKENLFFLVSFLLFVEMLGGDGR